MQTITSTEIQGIQTAQQNSFNSVCTLKTKAVTFDTLGDTVSTFTETENVSCGVKFDKGNQIIVRFPLNLSVSGSSLSTGDLVEITSHYGNSVSELYEIQDIVIYSAIIKAVCSLYVEHEDTTTGGA